MWDELSKDGDLIIQWAQGVSIMSALHMDRQQEIALCMSMEKEREQQQVSKCNKVLTVDKYK